MVYDPIRDIDVPSPASSSHAGDQPWRHNLTPGSGAYFDPAREGDYGISPSDGRGGYDGRPPAFQSNGVGHSPSATMGMKRSVSGGLRGLLNDEEDTSRRSSAQSGVSMGGGEEDHRPSISRMLNDDRRDSRPMVKSTSISSLVSSSPANASPDLARRQIEHQGFLTPASTSARASRSPFPSHPTSLSPSQHPSHLPPDNHGQEYSPQPEALAGPSGRRVSAGVPRPMLPPDTIPRQEYYDPSRITPGAQIHSLPLRSPSVSVSPRSNHQSLSGYSSRPTSAMSNPPQSYPAPIQLDSPSFIHQPLPQNPSRSPSEPRSRQTSAAPRQSRRSSVSSRAPLQSPIPVKPPYNPNRISQPTSVLRPITSDEISRLRSLAVTNNPLRRRPRKAAPSWSGPSPGPSRNRELPAETDSSYFPSGAHQTPDSGPSRSSSSARRGSVTSGATALTPGGQTMAVVAEVPSGKAGAKRKGSISGKRGAPDSENGHDGQRRKANDGHYIGNSAVASHYNSRPDVGVENREFSPIIGLKKFNNWIKSVLIGKFTYKGPNGRGGAHVLDIGCGKGGDLNKWRVANIKLYVALDIADMSVNQARDRFNGQSRRPFDAHFFAHDCFSQPLSDILPPTLAVRDLYDNVTMQFCMHYAFESPNKARMMMENVSRYLRTGGVFIGTIPNAETLLGNLDAVDPELRFGNSCYFIEFTERHHKGMYGHAYRFYLEDAVDDVPEYLVHWDNFVSLAQEYRLRLVYKKTFAEVLSEEQSSRDFGGLLAKMKVIDENGESAMDPDQWEAANLYMAFAFEKY